MSNEINSSLSNISTTEDVFDQFQSGAMFEEGEYITLNELVSPSHTNTEVIDTIIDLPTTDAEISSTMQRENNPQYNKSDLQESTSLIKHIHHSDLPLTSLSPVKTIKKRGRKKKVLENENHSQNIVQEKSQNLGETTIDGSLDLNYDMIIGEDSTSDQLLNCSTTKQFSKGQMPKTKSFTPRKRGRPPKSANLANKKEINEMSSDFKLVPNIYQNKKQQSSQRGRKKIINSDSQPIEKSTNDLGDLTCAIAEKNNTQKTCKNKDQNYDDKEILLNKKESKELGTGSKEKNAEHRPLIKISKTKSKNTFELNNKTESLTQKATTISIVAQRKGRPKKQNKKTLQESLVDSNTDITEKKEEDCLDDLCLSKLKECFENNESVVDSTTKTEISLIKNNRMPTQDDFENNIDPNVKESEEKVENHNESLFGETSKRPVRRRIRKTLHYEEEPDEDPFANMESSDDEPRKSKKGNRYYSDDEYIPGMRHGKRQAQFSDSDIEEFQCNKKQRKKKVSKSPKKKDKNSEAEFGPDITTIKPKDLDDDIEGSLETSVIKLNDDQVSNWGSTNEFENFLAKKIVGSEILIKKAKSDTVIAPLQIPVLDPNEPKKIEQISTQTESLVTKSAGVQTDSLYEVPMKKQIKLTAEQSDKACEFLSNIVKTTAELGQLMTQKSEDFIEKKINTAHVTDTFKMDYCVKKSFLLFKLAKHNLIQMEEDLSKQYDEFLKNHNLMQYREEQKILSSKNKEDSDSDCEIIEVESRKDEKKEEKLAFNPKTVFLNKELSIKIAKKSSAEPKVKENLNVKGRHTVWINDSIMVKKVKPNQSFLAQDSRNKKPPDTFITLEMVNNFFKKHSRQTALSVCAPFVKADWIISRKLYTCSYFTDAIVGTSKNLNVLSNHNAMVHLPESQKNKVPKSLLLLCMKVLECYELTGFNEKENISGHLTEFGNNCNRMLSSIPLLNTKPKSSCIPDFEDSTDVCNRFSNLEILKESNPCNNFTKTASDTSKSFFSRCNNEDFFSNVSPRSLLSLSMVQLANNLYFNYRKCDSVCEKKLDMMCNLKFIRDTAHIPSDNISSAMSISVYNTISNDPAKGTEKNVITKKNNENSSHSDIQRHDYNPASLLTLCMQSLEKNIINKNNNENSSHSDAQRKDYNPASLLTLCIQSLEKNIINKNNNENSSHSDAQRKDYNPASLLTLCIKSLEKHIMGAKIAHSDATELIKYGHKETTSQNIVPLKTLSLTKIIDFYFRLDAISLNQKNCLTKIKSLFSICVNFIKNIQASYRSSQRKINKLHVFKAPNLLKYMIKNHDHTFTLVNEFETKVKIKKLSSICLELISSHLSNNRITDDKKHSSQKKSHNNHIEYNKIKNVMSLTKLSLKKIIIIMNFPHFNKESQCQHLGNIHGKEHFPLVNMDSTIDLSITINNINTVTEDMFNNDYNYNNEYIAYDNTEIEEQDDHDIYDSYENDYGESLNEKNEWMSQIRMEELRSGIDIGQSKENLANHEIQKSIVCNDLLVNVKIEPANDELEMSVDTTTIKTEPVETAPVHQPSMEVILKLESFEPIPPLDESIELVTENRKSYNVDAFEAFVTTNKLMFAASKYNMINDDEIYSQSNSRIRRQFEPDFDAELGNFAYNMDLLVPQSVEQAKDRLMHSSSDEEKKNTKRDTKKINKRKVKLKKKTKNTQQLNNKQALTNDLTNLAKKMKNKIRQEYNETETSDTEDMPLIFIKEKEKISSKKDKEVCIGKVNTTTTQPNSGQHIEKEIQCNNVDSTDTSIDVNMENKKKHRDIEDVNTEMHNVIINMNENDSNFNIQSENLNTDSPVELRECEPTLAMVDSLLDKNQLEKELEHPSYIINDEISKDVIIRNGWQCYPINNKDSKIYQYAYVGLEKLPESFVETYFQYMNIEKNEDDEEIYRLTNLQTLHKINKKEMNRTSIKKNTKDVPKNDEPSNALYESVENIENVEAFCNELSLSEDEDDNISDISCPEQAQYIQENSLAKNLLMNDNESDSEKVANTNSDTQKNKDDSKDLKIKHKICSPSNNENINLNVNHEDLTSTDAIKIKNERHDEIASVEITFTPEFENGVKLQISNDCIEGDENRKYNETDYPEKKKPGPKSKTMVRKKESTCDTLLLTADRVMNSELAQLHAPITAAPDQAVHIKETKKKYSTRNSTKNPPNDETTAVHIKQGDDSSSEEEKQWVTTKEKLLKRLEKKQENNVDDAKRAKIVSEFIEKRGDGPVCDVMRQRPRARRPRSKKKLLERRKQMKVLSRELFGEDSSYYRKSSGKLGKGRRNIRKVIDKKSLTRSTVLANMQEFERKQRLSQRQSQLREALGCEQEVNVVVVNDELCLEYDFEMSKPRVTVHPYFTKIMKDHQYEGVKFMWDACFESVEMVQRGTGGGGCILAHCMGLGKTLQVLALLHTVYVHPLVAMRRVLVCCPLSTVLNWVDEIHKWFGPVTDQIKVFELSKLKKTYERAYQLEDWYNGGGIFIIGYELFRSLTTLDPMLDDVRPTIVNKIRTALLDPGPDMIICDEGHLLKNDLSVLAVAMSRVMTKRRIILTGTPMQNNLREYYCMVKFVKPNLLGTYAEYSNRFENPIMNGQHRDSREEDILLMKTRTHILHKVLEGCLQRQEASVLYPYLPKKYEYTVFISLTTCQWDLYKHYMKNYAHETKQSVLKDFHVLQKIWSHPQVLHNFQTRSREVEGEGKIKAEKLEDDLAREDYAASEDMKPSPTDVWWLQYLHGGQMLDALDTSHKFLVVFRLLDECAAIGDKVLIFSTSLYTLDALEYFLRRINGWSLGQQYYRLDGSVPAEVRQKWCREFNAETNTGTKLFLISTRAGCLGLNMTAANRVIILDTSWNPAHDIQSIFRVYRFGQKKDCYIYRLVALGTMEQKIYERSVTKQAVACRVVDEQQIDRHYNSAELSELYKYDEEGVSVGAGLAAGVHDTVLLRVAGGLGEWAAALHAVREHDSLLRDMSEARLPEHERAAAWRQFQQEHETKQMQSLEVSKPKKPVKEIRTSDVKSITTQLHSSGLPARVTRGMSNLRGAVDENTPSTSKQSTLSVDPRSESTVIQKIREILIQHQVTSMKPEDMSQLILKVREYISTRPKNNISDPVITSIANVLLGETGPNTDGVVGHVEPETIVGDLNSSHRVISESDFLEIKQELLDEGDNIELQMGEKRRRTRRNSDEEYVPTYYYHYSLRRKQKLTPVADNVTGDHLTVSNVPESSNVGGSTDISPNHMKVVDNYPIEVPKRKRGRPPKGDIINHRVDSLLLANTICHKAQEEMLDNSTVVGQSLDSIQSIENAVIEVHKRKKGRPRKSGIQNLKTLENQAAISEPNLNSYTSQHETITDCILLEDSCSSIRSDVNIPKVIKKYGRSRKCETAKQKEMQHIDVDQVQSQKSEMELTQNNICLDPTPSHSPTLLSVSTKADSKSKIIGPHRKKYVVPIANQADKQEIGESGIIEDNVFNSDDDLTPIAGNIIKENIDIEKLTQTKRGPSKQRKEIDASISTENPKANPVSGDADGVTEESILLSDDDDVSGEYQAPTMDDRNVRVTAKELTATDSIGDITPTPLPKTLLTDSNFIKIVAHMYVSGNPMLDEDAALLAAQYSTLKAFKEVESTGVGVTSGPLYDIAMKVYGKDGLMKLLNAPTDKNTREVVTEVKTKPKDGTNKTRDNIGGKKTSRRSEQKKEQTNEEPKVTEPKQNKTKTQNKNIIVKYVNSGAAPSVELVRPRVAGAGGSSQPAVVPVGLFKGPGAVGAPSFGSVSSEECILPDDDDDVILGGTAAPAATTGTKSSQLHRIQLSGLQRSIGQPLVLKSVSSKKIYVSPISSDKVPTILKRQLKGTSVTTRAGPPTLTICNGKLVLHNNSTLTDNLPAPTTTVGNLIANTITKDIAPKKMEKEESLQVNTDLGDGKLPKLNSSTSTPAPAPTSYVTIDLDSDDDDASVIPPTKAVECRLKKPAGEVTVVNKQKIKKNKVVDNDVASSINTIITTSKETIVSKRKLQKIGSISNETKGAQMSDASAVTAHTICNKDSSTKTVKKSNQAISDNGTLTKSIGDVNKPPKIPKITKAKQLANTAPPHLFNESVGSDARSTKTFKTDAKDSTTAKDKADGASTKIDNSKNEECSMIDLTECDVRNSGRLEETIVNKSRSSTLTTPMIGTSKDIFITNTGTLASVNSVSTSATVDLTDGYVTEVITIPPQRRAPPGHQGTVTGRKNESTSSKANSKISESTRPSSSTAKAPAMTSTPTPSVKRAAPHEAASVTKKKKTESRRPLTLKDFNLDDFDDIVELE